MKKLLTLLVVLVSVLVLSACQPKPKLTIAEEDLTVALTVGQNKTIEVTVNQGELEWVSGNTSIVTVTGGNTSGVITAVGAGTAKITVSIKDTAIKAEITVTVTLPTATAVTITGAGNVVVGSALQLTGAVTPAAASQTLTWVSNNTSVATVSATGLVTGVGAGEAKITATSSVSTVKAEVTVNVVLPDPATITVTGPNEVILGATGQYAVSVLPALAPTGVTWSTSDATKATVDAAGLVTGVAEGIVQVIATSIAKNTVSGQKAITIVLPQPTAITITGDTTVLVGEQATYTVAVAPALALQTVTWSVSDATKASIDATTGVLTATTAGTFNVIATSTALSTVVGQLAVTVEAAGTLVEFELDGGYWPITSMGAFMLGNPVSTTPLNGAYNASAGEYYVSEGVGAYTDSIFINDANRKISPSVWQNRAFLNKNANGFYEVKLVLVADSANVNPPLDDYAYTIYAHSGYTVGYDFIGALQAGQLVVFSGFDFDDLETFKITGGALDVYAAAQGNTVESLYAEEGFDALPIPKKPLHDFLGWYDNDEFTGDPVTEIGKDDVVLYAKWESQVDMKYVLVTSEYDEGELFFSELADRYLIKGLSAFDTLAEAIAAVEEGGTVYVDAGEYAGTVTIDKDDITIVGTVGAVLTTVFNVAANVEGLTMQDLEFTGSAQIVMAAAGGIKGFTFKNNLVTSSTLPDTTFIGFDNDGTANNEDFVIVGNQFLIDADQTNAPRWIRGGNIVNLTVENNIFEGVLGVFTDALRIEGTNTTNSSGVGLSGVVEIHDNTFDTIGQRAIWIRRITATEFNFTNNLVENCGSLASPTVAYGGGLQIEVSANATELKVNIIENTFKDISYNFGIRLGTAAVPTIGEVDIRFNQFVNFALTGAVDPAKYVQGYAGATNIVANQNFFTVLPTATDMPNVTSYEPAFDDLDDLIAAIAISKPQTLTFDSQGGSAVAPQEVPGGFTAEEPVDPTRDGYTFVGWFKEAAGTNAFDFDVDVVDESMTVYAKWTAIQYNVTYDYDGGELAFETQEEMFIAFITDFYEFLELNPSEVSLSDFMHGVGKTSGFDGLWILDGGDYRGSIYAGPRPTEPIEDSETFIEDARYYAKWMPFLDMMQDFIKYVNATQAFWEETVHVGPIRLRQFFIGTKPVAWVPDAVMAQLPKYTAEHPTYTIAAATILPTPFKDGFVFAGWYDNEYLLGEAISVIPAGQMGDIELFAAWVEDVLHTGEIIVDASATLLHFGHKFLFQGNVYEVGVNYFTSLAKAALLFEEGDIVYVLPGTYVGDFTITVNDVTIYGNNALINPNLEVRSAESVIDGVITIDKELSDITISGFKFVGESQVLNVKGTAGLAAAVTTNLDGFVFAHNIVESELEAGKAFLHFSESSNSYSNNLAFVDNYFTVVVEDSALEQMIQIDNNAGLTVVGNVFENIPNGAFFLYDTTKGLAGDTFVSENAFVNIGGDAFKIGWLSPLPSTTMEVMIINNLFDGVGGIAVYFGSMNNTDVIGALHILYNEFRSVDGGVHLNCVHATTNALVNFNKFLDVPVTFYVKDAKTAATPVTLNATKNAYLEDGKVMTPDVAKFVGSPDYSTALTGSIRFNAYGKLEVSFDEFETNSDMLRIQFVEDWNDFFGTTWTTLNANAFHDSASTGAGGNATYDVSDSNIYKFFHDNVYGEKWGWLIDFLQTKGGIHPQRQLVALKGDGTSPIPDSTLTYQLWNLSHLTYSFANFFNQATANNGWAPIDFNVLSKYDTVADFNDKVYRNFELYEMVYDGQTIELPEPPVKTNYIFVKYTFDSVDYNPGDTFVIDEDMVISVIYAAVVHDVTFFDGEVELTDLATTYTHEAAKTLPTPTKDGYLFQGWFATVGLEGTAITAIPVGSTGDKVFYSKWLELEYVEVDVTFELNGGLTGAYIEATRYSTAGDATGAAITVGTARGGLYWYVIGMKATDVAGIYEVLGKGTGYTNVDATLYLSYHDGCTSSYKSVLAAKYAATVVGDLIHIPWLPAAVTGSTSIDVLFLDDSITSVEVKMLLPDEFPVMMVRPDHEFLGWYDNAEFTGEPVATYPGFDDALVTEVTYYAKWKAPEVELLNIMISQAYGGGGNSGATYTHDFIELYNPNDVAVVLDGWTIQYASATGLFASFEGNKVVLTGTIAAKGFFLIQAAQGNGGTEPLPTPDFITTISMGGTSFKLALANDDTTVVTATDENVVDLVGAASNANIYEGTGPAPAPSNTTAIIRADLVDTNDNAADFTIVAPAPRNSAYVFPVE